MADLSLILIEEFIALGGLIGVLRYGQTSMKLLYLVVWGILNIYFISLYPEVLRAVMSAQTGFNSLLGFIALTTIFVGVGISAWGGYIFLRKIAER